MLKHSVIAFTAAAVIAATGGATLAGADSTDTTAAALEAATNVAATTPSVLASPVATVDPTAAKAFKLFKDQPASPMPADIAAGVGSPAKFGRNPNLARAINTPKGKGWLIPGRGYVCLAVPTGVVYATTCQPTSIAADDGLQIGVGTGNSVKDDLNVTTVAPAGSNVVAVEPDGDMTDVPSSAEGVSTTTVSPDTTVAVTAP